MERWLDIWLYNFLLHNKCHDFSKHKPRTFPEHSGTGRMSLIMSLAPWGSMGWLVDSRKRLEMFESVSFLISFCCTHGHVSEEEPTKNALLSMWRHLRARHCLASLLPLHGKERWEDHCGACPVPLHGKVRITSFRSLWATHWGHVKQNSHKELMTSTWPP